MAPRKTTSRKKRSTRGKSSGHSATAVLTVGAIVVIGAAALWATSQSRSPSASVSGLFRTATNSSASRSGSSATASSERRSVQTQSRNTETARNTEPTATPPSPIRRPPLNIGQSVASEQKEQPKQVAVLAPRPDSKPAAVQVTPPKPAPQHTMPALPPVGKSATDDNSRHASGAFKVPKAIIARQALTIHEKAWDKAKTVGRVEKGREMRSYAKVGRWHRVVVPSTNIIGWVQEDQLIIKNQQAQTRSFRAVSAPQAAQHSGMTTGSIRSAATADNNSAAKKTQNSKLVAPVYPQQPVGK